MTVRQFSRTCLFGAFLGFCVALLARSISLLMGKRAPLLLMIALVVAGAVLWTVYKILQERVLAKDYGKMIAARQRRMR